MGISLKGFGNQSGGSGGAKLSGLNGLPPAALAASPINPPENITGDITTGLIAHYEFTSNLTDTVGTYNGTGYGTVGYSIGRGGSGSAVDITTDYSYIETGIPQQFPITIAMWVYLPGTSTNYRGVLGDHDSPQYTGLIIQQEPTYAENFIFQSGFGTAWAKECACLITDNAWNHVVVMADTRLLRTYNNGNLIDEETQTSDLVAPGTIKLGRSKDGAGRYMRGYFDDVRIYNRLLTSDDVATLYNN